MAEQDSRDDKAIRHFASRSQQPRVLAGGSYNNSAPPSSMTPIQVHIHFDQGPAAAEVDNAKWAYVGADSQISKYEHMSARKIRQDVHRY